MNLTETDIDNFTPKKKKAKKKKVNKKESKLEKFMDDE